MAEIGTIHRRTGIDLALPGRHAIRVPGPVLALCLALADILAIAASAVLIDLGYHRFALNAERAISEPFSLGLAVATIFAGWVYCKRGYTLQHMSGMRGQLMLAGQAWLVSFFVIAWFGFLSKSTAEYSRLSWTLVFLFGFVSVVGVRIAATRLMLQAVQQSRLSVHKAYLIVAGGSGRVEHLVAGLRSRGILIAGATAIDASPWDFDALAERLQEAGRRSRELLEHDDFECVYVYTQWRGRPWLDLLRTVVSPLPLPVYLVGDESDVPAAVPDAVPGLDRIGLEIQRAPLTWNERFLKRAFDLAVASLALVLLMPLMAIVGIAILVETGRPILFYQERKGFGGKRFRIIKFRTMHVHTDAELRQACRDDSRVTRFGRVLRRTSIDELPQLLNVIAGDMSIVGPRPHAVKHDNIYDELISSYAHRRRVRPGITGWAQVHGLRGETREIAHMEARVRHDLSYIANWSFWLDIRIAWRTAVIVLFDRNAF